MSIASRMVQDLMRMTELGQTQLWARGSDDPDILAEADFVSKHGVTRAQHAEAARARSQQIAEDEIRRDHESQVPADITAERGLSPARREYARYAKWLKRTKDELDQLLSIRTHLTNLVEAPNRTASAIAESVRNTAKSLLRGVTGSDDGADERHKLDEQLAADKHRAESAREALTELETSITEKQMHVETLEGREPEFLRPAMCEIFDASGLAKVIVRKRAELEALEEIASGIQAFVDQYCPLYPSVNVWSAGIRRHRLPRLP
jgi:hypothetical protein